MDFLAGSLQHFEPHSVDTFVELDHRPCWRWGLG